MAYNELLANRIRIALQDVAGVEEKAMFGGLCFMVNEKMCIGVVKDEIMCRVDPAIEVEALEKPGSRQMDFTGKSMKGFVFVDESGIAKPADFAYWMQQCLAYNPQAKSSKKKK